MKAKPRIILDTNLIISALLREHSPACKVFDKANSAGIVATNALCGYALVVIFCSMQKEAAMATIVLVPGATLGSWIWKRVTPLLRSFGHEVYPITLTGLAERAHLLSPSIDRETHIQDIVRLIEVEDLSNVIIVAHSLGVDPATGAADRIPQQVARLVYFDSLPAKNGESGLKSDNEEFVAWILGQVIETERGSLFRPPDSRNFGLSEDADIAWANSKMTHHPFKAWTDIAYFQNPDALARIPKSYISCIGDNPPGEPPRPGTEGMDYYELPFGHLAMINAPNEVASLLHQIASQPV